MHELSPLIKDLAIILGFAGLITVIFQKIRQPVVLGYLVTGMLIGPYTPPYLLVSDIPNVQTLSMLGIIFLMFSLGLEFSFHKLKRVGFSASVTGIIEVIGVLLLGMATGFLLGWSFFDSLFLGAAICISSTMIIIKAIEELKLKTKHFAEITFGILIVEDLLAILLLVILSTIVISSDIFSMELLWATLQLIMVVGGWFLMGYFLIPSIFHHITPYINEETLTIVVIALCLFLVCVATAFGYSAALGAFIMGSILAETPLINRIEHVVTPIRNIFAAVFFVSVGMLIDPMVIIEEWSVILILCAVTILGKLLITGVGAFLGGQTLHNSIRIGFSMAQIGEFSFIIIGLGLSLSVISPTLYPIIVAVAVITTFTTPYLIRFSGHLNQFLDQNLSTRVQYFFNSYTSCVQRVLHHPHHQPGYRKAIIQFLLNAGIVGIIFLLTEKMIFPIILNFLPYPPFDKGLTFLTVMLLSSPFIWGMLVAFRIRRSEKNLPFKPPALYLSWMITVTEIAVLSFSYFDTWIISIALLMIVVIFFILLYKQLDKSYHWFETQLTHNLQNNENIDVEQSSSVWNAEPIELKIQEKSPLIGTQLNAQQIRQEYGINIVAVAYQDEVILISHYHQPLPPSARLIVLGEESRINHFIEMFILEKL